MTIQGKTNLEQALLPKAVHKGTGQVFILVRDDVKANGKLYLAPVGQMTSMRSIRPDEFKENFEWYVDPKDRPQPPREVFTAPLTPEGTTQESVQASIEASTKKKGGRPKGSKDTKPRKRTRKKT
jgi:hypothetical protein